jgi:hypothetical protein
VILILGDYDPSGQDIIRNTSERLHEWGEGWIADVETLAVTPEQIEQWDLPTRPTKKQDPRAAKFRGESVELDAIPPKQFRQLIRDGLMRWIDQDDVTRSNRAEKRDKRQIHKIARLIPKAKARRDW